MRRCLATLHAMSALALQLDQDLVRSIQCSRQARRAAARLEDVRWIAVTD